MRAKKHWKALGISVGNLQTVIALGHQEEDIILNLVYILIYWNLDIVGKPEDRIRTWLAMFCRFSTMFWYLCLNIPDRQILFAFQIYPGIKSPLTPKHLESLGKVYWTFPSLCQSVALLCVKWFLHSNLPRKGTHNNSFHYYVTACHYYLSSLCRLQ